MKILKVTVSDETAEILGELAKLHGWDKPEQALAYLASSATDGVKRPGSWERGWLAMAFPLDMVNPDNPGRAR